MILPRASTHIWPWLNDKLYNKSATNTQQIDNPQQVYIKSTTVQQIELMEPEHNPISQQSSIPVGLPTCKNGKDRSRTQRTSTVYLGSPEVITDGTIRRRQNFLYFLSTELHVLCPPKRPPFYLAYVISEENFSNCCTAALAVYLLLFSVSYYLHSPGTASGACYRRRACMQYGHVEACGSGLLRHACGISRCVGEFPPHRVGFLLLSDD